jgi:hypothetical protein
MFTFQSKAFAGLFLFAISLATHPAVAAPPNEANAFQASGQFTVGANFSELCASMATIPAKKRLVIEYVSVTVGPLSTGSSMRSVQLRTHLAGQEKSLYHNITQVFPGSLELVFGQLVKLYSDDEMTVCVSRTGNLMSALPVFSTISGYLVDQ